MESSDDETVTVEFSKPEALVLFDFLARYSYQDSLQIEHQAEQRVLWDLCCMLEASLVEPFRSDFPLLLEQARLSVADDLEPENEPASATGEMRSLNLARALILRCDAGGWRVLLNRFVGSPIAFLPGGQVEDGEAVVRALARELVEELGVLVEVGAYVGAVEHQWPEGVPTHYEVNHVFLVDGDAITDPPVSLEDDLEFFWQRVGELAEVNLQPSVLPELIARYVAGERAPWWGSTLPLSTE